MCGIAGYFGSKEIPLKRVEETLQLMKRRGPNGQKHERIKVGDSKNCYLLHSRLSILDLDPRSDQPFHYNGKTLVYNGEIYNYLEVKEELIKLGHQFITKSDTEVLIHALDEWGQKAFDKVEGMWSFALFDHKEKTLLLSRDPFGEKPLYIYEPELGEIYFGSEVKFLAQLSGKKFTPNINHISRFLVNGYKSLYKEKETFFREIYEVEKSTFVHINLNDFRIRKTRYWTPSYDVKEDMSFEEAVSKTRDLMINSVETRLRSDIPIAFHMSGGVDSNSLISIAKRVFDYDVHGFTIVNSDSRYEEQEMVDLSVQKLGIKHHGLTCNTENFIENLTELVRYHDAPVLTITFYLNWLLQQQIKDRNYHISISGTAADEVFSGYFDHHLMYFYDIRNDESLLKERVGGWQREVAPIVRNPFLKSYDNFIKNPFQRGHAYLNNHIYSSYLKTYWQEPFTEKHYRPELLRNRMLNEIFHETTPVIVHEEDLNAMYYSIENRSPFLNRKLFEFAQSIPTQHLIRDGRAKAVLRESMRGIVEDPILDSARKVGFNAPITDLLDLSNKKVRETLLSDSPIFDVIKKESIEGFILRNEYPNSDSKFLFSFLSSKLFLEEFC